MKSLDLFIVLFFSSSVSSLKLRLPVRREAFRSSGLKQSPVKRGYRSLDTQDEVARKESSIKVPTLTSILSPKRRSLKIEKLRDIQDSQPTLLEILRDEEDEILIETALKKRGFRRNRNLTEVSNVHELRQKILDENVPLKDISVKLDVADATPEDLLNHDVVELIVRRYHDKSTPGHRAKNDDAILALSMEGGGMRGAVSAGMAAAIASLGLTDCFDRIYGSSAGSVIGAYMVSRQMCMDVYVDILPAAKRLFVCTKRLLSWIGLYSVDFAFSRSPVKALWPKLAHRTSPGMNISFVLDGIMDHEIGIRPLDYESFRENDKYQPLRVASSYAKNGKLYTKCFGTENFFPESDAPAKRADGRREGLYACLEASMTVPGATGPPVPIIDHEEKNQTLSFFDAFCFEPLPFRSAVEEGATHALVLCSRPEGFQPKTAQGVYERGVAPLYFREHGEPEVAEFFERGGQQYIYAEDLLTLEEGKRAGMKTGDRKPISVPPPRILYGVDRDVETEMIAKNRDQWKKAHLLPLKVPQGTPELPTLEQGRDEVLEAVRGGYAAAFDLLAPAIGLQLDTSMTGMEVAKLVFPSESRFEGRLLHDQVYVKGDPIRRPDGTQFSGLGFGDILGGLNEPQTSRRSKRGVVFGVMRSARNRIGRRKTPVVYIPESPANEEESTFDQALHLLDRLPGFESGKMAHLASNLQKLKS